MAYQSKTYSLSDEVVAAIETAKAQGLSPNRLLKWVLLDKDGKLAQRLQAKNPMKTTARNGKGRASK